MKIFNQSPIYLRALPALLAILLLSMAGFFSVAAHAQIINKDAFRYYKQSEQDLNTKNYPAAIAKLKQATRQDATFTAAYQRLGDVYRLIQDTENAGKCYEIVIRQQPDFLPRNYYYLGLFALQAANYQSAKQYLTQFFRYPRAGKLQKAAQRALMNANFALLALQKPHDIQIIHLSEAVNTAADEYLPSITADGNTLIFTRKTDNNEDIYYATKVANTWLQAAYLSDKINTTTYNEGAQSISPDGKTLYFTMCNAPLGFGRCDIYYAKKQQGGWSKPINLGKPVNTSSWESQPCMAADGKTLYFVSNRLGGFGGFDIWKTTLQADGLWTEAENLGENINTAFDEQSPFIHPDGRTLYFSSDGWPGMGGKDLFMSKIKPGKPRQKPVNMGASINTAQDEFSLTVTGNGGIGYFASNHLAGNGGYDLYRFELPAALKPDSVVFFTGIIYDQTSKEKLSASLQIVNLTTGEMVLDKQIDPGSGDFLASLPAGYAYALNVSKKGYLFYSDYMSTLTDDLPVDSIQNQLNILNIQLRKLDTTTKTLFKNVFFESDSYQLSPKSWVELDAFAQYLRQNPHLKIEIAGHTDDIGTAAYNQILSENRSKAVYTYLNRQVLNPSRFICKGYGKQKPINKSQTDDARTQNRRTEFRVMSF